MGYEVQAVIAGDELLRAVSRDVPGARVAPLRQGLSLMPMTDEVFDAVTDGGTEGALGFWRLPGASRSCSPSGPPQARWPMWRPSTSAARVSNAPRSGPTGNWFWDRWTRRRGNGSPGRSARSRGRYGDSAREGAWARTNSTPWDWTAIGTTTVGSVDRRARRDAELRCVLVIFSGCGPGGIGPGRPAGGVRAHPDRLRGHALAHGGGFPAAITDGGDGSPRLPFPRTGTVDRPHTPHRQSRFCRRSDGDGPPASPEGGGPSGLLVGAPIRRRAGPTEPRWRGAWCRTGPP